MSKLINIINKIQDYINISKNNLKKKLEINELPNDVLKKIQSYLPLKYFTFTNKYYYKTNHQNDKEYVLYHNYYPYIHFIIKNDYDFIFELILKDSSYKFYYCILNNNTIKFNIFQIDKEYFTFFLKLCNKYDSIKCLNILTQYFKKHRIHFY